MSLVLIPFRAGLPPAIALAMYRSDDVSQTYGTLGFLVAIISILGFCIMPRAKFIQTMIVNLISTCLGAGVCMLMVWSGVQARLHTTPAGAPPQRYNASQSAVCGVWLFFQIYVINSAKAKFPQFAFPAILYSIFVNVSAGFGTRFTSPAQARNFIQQLLEAFLTGFAIATAVSLFIVPLTSRKVALKAITGYMTALRGALQAHKKYLQSLETTDVFSPWKTYTDDLRRKKPEKKPEIQNLKKYTTTLTQLYAKLRGDLAFAKRETAWGKLTADDFEAIFKHMRAIMLPLVGLSSLADLFERIGQNYNWAHDNGFECSDEEEEALHMQTVQDWHEIMERMHDPIEKIVQVMDGGLEHAMLRLQLTKPAKKRTADEEAKGGLIRPGDDGYADYLESEGEIFYEGKGGFLRQWVQSKGVQLPENYFDKAARDPYAGMAPLTQEPTFVHQRQQRQLYVLLYVIFLLHSISRAILDLTRWADEKDMAKKKKKFIFPGRKRVKKWIKTVLEPQDGNHDEDATLAGVDRDYTIVHMGEAYKKRKNPEHLPPENAFERFGDGIRAIAAFFRSPESTFGFRVACATMTIAIIGFLRDTQAFFVTHRLMWAMIMVSISMTPTAGQSVWAFVLRIAGTCIAMIVAWLIWYIPGQHTAGIIVFLWLFTSLGFYIPLKRPDLIIAGIIAVITSTLITGYELQVRKLGRQLAESNGQPAYEIYVLGPYRLATVIGGLAVAFIWTFFPYPISEHSALRIKLGNALYLSANYYSIIHETVMGRIRGDEGDPTDKDSPAFKLGKMRNKVFAKQLLLLQSLRTHSSFVKWEFPLGGKFPTKEYNHIIELVTKYVVVALQSNHKSPVLIIHSITNYSALISYASESFLNTAYATNTDPTTIQWFEDFRRVILEARLTSHEITSTLALLSSSITNGQPLPPYLNPPQAYLLSKRMEQIDKDILSIRHIAEPGYAAFAVLQISTSCISMDLERLLRAVKRLVGELDFSFQVVGSGTRGHSVAPSYVDSEDRDGK